MDLIQKQRRQIGPQQEPKPIAGPQEYDRMYASGDRTYERPLSSPYYPLFRKVAETVHRERIASILEVGCGSGVLAEMLLQTGIRYRGFDFSPIAIEKAKRHNAGAEHFLADACSPSSYASTYDGIVCCEVLEHIESDLEAIKLWKPGTFCVCSVPNFDDDTHVRLFRSEAEVRERYSELIDISGIQRLTKSPSAGLTWGEYIRRLRWARENPKEFFGILGINRFDWYGGWFLFSGRRH